MVTYLDEVAAQAREWDDARPRSSQGLGWSGMADCRAYMGFKISGEWPSDDEENWRAITGTAMHEWLTEVRREALYDVPGMQADFGLEVSYGGVKGHADEIVWTKGEVTDYKFPRLASARVWDDPDVLEERFTQVHGYAAAVVGTDKWRAWAPVPDEATVRMLVCPVDGTFSDWAVYEEPFDRGRADEALRRLGDVREYLAQGERPPRDKPYFFCERWCEFFTLCRGGSPEHHEWPEIHDPELASAVERYGLAGEQHRAAEKLQKELGPLVRGLRGSARGWRVSMTREGPGRMVPDERAITADYAEIGREVPLRPAPGAPAKLRIVREKR